MENKDLLKFKTGSDSSINLKLVEALGIDDKTHLQIEQLQDLRHMIRESLSQGAIEPTPAIGNLLSYINESLCKLWDFKDVHKYKFWEEPCCACPKMDNDDLYESDLSIVNSECPLHSN